MRRLLAILAAALLAGALVACKVPHPRGRWNVVVILVDTLRADHLGAYGYGRPTSPHFDALAKGSYLFTQARSQASCTFPSANSILTSRYPTLFIGQPGRSIGIPAGVRSIAEVLAGHGWATAAVSASPLVRNTPSRLNPGGGYGRGFGRFDEDCQWREAGCVANHGLFALDRMREPFFLYLHFMDPHGPYRPRQPFRREFRVGSTDKDWVQHGDPRPIADMLYDNGPRIAFTPDDVRFLQGLYDGEIAAFDDELARLVDELRRRDLLDRTVLAIVADHGESFLDHQQMGHCRSVYDSEIKTPFLLRLPRQKQGVRIPAAVQNLDLVPTLVDLLGLPTRGEKFEGVSLLPLLDDGAPGERYAYGFINTHRSVFDGRWKLVHDLKTKKWELFDLRADPGETRDVVRDNHRVFARLRDHLLAWVERTEGSTGAERGEEAERRLKALGYL